jgi:hypothetical protein
MAAADVARGSGATLGHVTHTTTFSWFDGYRWFTDPGVERATNR